MSRGNAERCETCGPLLESGCIFPEERTRDSSACQYIRTLSVSLQNTTSVNQTIFLSPVLSEIFVAAVRRRFMSLILCAEGWQWKPFPIVTEQIKGRWGQTKMSQEAKSLTQTKMKREAQYESVYSQASLNFTCRVICPFISFWRWRVVSAAQGQVG